MLDTTILLVRSGFLRTKSRPIGPPQSVSNRVTSLSSSGRAEPRSFRRGLLDGSLRGGCCGMRGRSPRGPERSKVPGLEFLYQVAGLERPGRVAVDKDHRLTLAFVNLVHGKTGRGGEKPAGKGGQVSGHPAGSSASRFSHLWFLSRSGALKLAGQSLPSRRGARRGR